MPITGQFPAVIQLSSLNGANGFELDGVAVNDGSGGSVSTAGDVNNDVNNDGIQDIIIGAGGAPSQFGKTYVVFGKRTGWSSPIALSSLNGANGFELDGVAAGDNSGYSVSTAGDVNNDGMDDILIGAYNGLIGAGKTYVLFGKAAWTNPTALSSLNGTNGFELDGVAAGDNSGYSVSAAGDVNNDGFQDIILGAPYYAGGVGKTYVVFGKAIWTSPFLLSSLNGTNGFEFDGVAANDFNGYSVSTAGDVNSDGVDDIIIGAYDAATAAGKTYVVFGKAAWTSPISLSSLNGANGFELDGEVAYDQSGYAVGSGDFNGDGIIDIIIGAKGAAFNAGKTYVVFGENPSSFILLQNNLLIHGGETLQLNNNNLNASSPNSNPADIIFTISNLQHGYFEYVNNPGTAISSFTQQSVWDSQVQAVHDGTRVALSYDVQVNGNTFVFIPPQPGNVTFIIATPTFINNQLSIARGQTIYVTSTALQANELGFNNANLLFIVSDVSHGQFINYLEKSISNFTQQMVNDGGVRFVHDGSSNTPTYDIAISDGQITTAPQAAIVNFNPTVNTTVTTTLTAQNNTVRNAIIGGSISGGMGLGFLALKIFISRQAAKNLKKVLEGDSSETEKDQIEFHKHVIRPIANQLFEHINTTGCLGSRSKQASKAYIVAIGTIVGKLARQGIEIRFQEMEPSERTLLINEIIKQIKRHTIQGNTVTRFFRPAITPDALADKADDIVVGVCQALQSSVSPQSVQKSKPKNSERYVEMPEIKDEKFEEKAPLKQSREISDIEDAQQSGEDYEVVPARIKKIRA